MQLTLLVVQVSILYYGGHLVISGQMSSGNLIAFIIYEFVLGDCMEVRVRSATGLDLSRVGAFLANRMSTCKIAFRPLSNVVL